jgi:hypothetical protein
MIDLINNKQYMSQVRNFNGLSYGKISPTDIDGFLEYRNQLFVFIETKYGNTDLPTGQRIALTRLCDAVASSGKRAVLLVVRHEFAPDEDIMVAQCAVERYYLEGKWVDLGEGSIMTVRDAIDINHRIVFGK